MNLSFGLKQEIGIGESQKLWLPLKYLDSENFYEKKQMCLEKGNTQKDLIGAAFKDL